MPGRSRPKQRSVRRRKRLPPVIAALKRSASAKSSTLSASKKQMLVKRRSPPQRLRVTDGAELRGNRLLDISTLSEVIANQTTCANCGTRSLRVTENFVTRRGLVTDLSVVCHGCHNSTKLSDPYSAEATKLNRSSVFAMRFAGGGLHSLERFCGLMSLPPPVTDNSYREHQAAITAAAMKEAMDTCKQAANDLHQLAGKPCDENVDITVTCDGTWSTRGFTSQFGVVIVMSFETGRVLDFEVLSKYCHQCKLHSNDDKSSAAYIKWLKDHESHCSRNFQGSSPSMESEGALVLWRRSENLKLRYTTLISDGDAKTHAHLNEEDPYNGVPIEKQDCVGHVQKRMGSRLRKKKKEGYYSKEKKKVIGLGGKGRLTEAVMDSLQNYYGNAIRKNVGDIGKMKDAVWAIYYHSISTDQEPKHQHCPIGKDSWCKYNRAVAEGKEREFSHKRPLPEDVAQAIFPVFVDLADPKLLERCQLGATQNQNEALHHLIWGFCSKAIFQSLETVQLCVAIAVSLWNRGADSITQTIKNMGVEPGAFTMTYLNRLDVDHGTKAAWHEKEKTKIARKERRQRKKRKIDKNMQTEGITYEAGAF